MALDFQNLDARTRELMLSELDRDVARGDLYLSPRLSPQGQMQYKDLLRAAFETGNDESLAEALRSGGRISQTEVRRKKNGGVATVRVPHTAAATLAEGEFNRFYIRALCLRALESSSSELEVYRARSSASPRKESTVKVGTRVDAASLLQDLQTHQGVDTALGLSPGPNSGLSVRLA